MEAVKDFGAQDATTSSRRAAMTAEQCHEDGDGSLVIYVSQKDYDAYWGSREYQMGTLHSQTTQP